MFAFVICMLISVFFSDNHKDGINALRLRLPLILFPLSLGLISITKEQRNRILLGCAYIITAACFISLLYAVYRFYQTNNTAWLYNDALSFFIGQQSIYTSLLVNLSIYVFAWHLLFGNHVRKKRALLISLILFLFIISYLLASRNMMVLLYAATLFVAFYFILTKKKYLLGSGLLAGLVVAVIIIFAFFPQTFNRFRELAFTQFDFQSQAKESHYADKLTPDQWNGANFRLAAWQCGWEIFKEQPMLGVGLGDKKDELLKIYQQKRFQFAIDTNKNVHNNYLDILYSMGVAALLIFLLGWLILPIRLAFIHRDGLAIFFLVTLAFAMITENYFDRSLGPLLFGFFVCFIMTPFTKRTTH